MQRVCKEFSVGKKDTISFTYKNLHWLLNITDYWAIKILYVLLIDSVTNALIKIEKKNINYTFT